MTVSDWYLSALELVGDYGTLTREQCARLGVCMGDAHPGWYLVPVPSRWLREGAPPPEHYIRIWSEAGATLATIDGIPTDPADAFQAGCRNPISEDRYYRAARHGFTNLGAFRVGMTPPAGGTVGVYPYERL
jgi:hypothetical protein